MLHWRPDMFLVEGREERGAGEERTRAALFLSALCTLCLNAVEDTSVGPKGCQRIALTSEMIGEVGGVALRIPVAQHHAAVGA